MSKHILYCKKCKKYTMKDTCPDCGSNTFSVKPAKYSPEDKYGKYRRIAKRNKKVRRN